MKKQLSFLMTLSLGILLLFSGAIRLDAQTIIFLTDDDNEAYTVEFLQDQGLSVTTFWAGAHISTWGTDTITMLNAADLIIAGRSINSGEWSDSADRVAWNKLTAPILQLSPYAVRNTRNNWFNSGSAISVPAGSIATAIVPGDAVFDNVTLDGSDQMVWFPYNSNALLHTATDNNGTVIASIGDTIPLLVRWPLTGEPYYVDGPDTAASERVYFGFGIEAYGDLTPQATHFPLTRDAKQVFLAEVCRILGIAQQVAVFDKPYHFNILFLTDDDYDNSNYDFLVRQEFKMSKFWATGGVNNWGADTLAMLDAADLVIFGRSIGSTEFELVEQRNVWDSITAPCMYVSSWHARSNRNHLFNSTSAYHDETGTAQILLPADGIFDDVTLTNDSLVWWDVRSDGIMDNSGTSQGTWVAQINDSVPLIVRFDADKAFYAGGPDSAVAERVYFGFGQDGSGNVTWEKGYFPLSKDAKQVYLAEISRILGISAPAAVYGAPDYTITFITDDDADDVQQAWLRAQGFALDTIWPGSDITTWSQDTLDILNAAELIIIGRSVGSTESEQVAQRNIWDSITAPIIHCSPWALRNNRAHWFNTSTISMTNATITTDALAGDPIFEFASVENDSTEWVLANCDYLVDDSGDGQGTVVVGSATNPFLVRFEPDKAFYAGGPDSAVAERVHVAIGSEPAANYFPLSQNAQRIYYAEIMRLLGGQIAQPAALFGTDHVLAYLGTDKGTMTPDFAADVLAYTVVIGVNDGPIEVEALAAATVTVTGDGVYEFPADNADFNISVVATSGVGQTTTYTIAVDIDKSVDVEEFELDADYSIYPNPFSNTITINSSEVITNVAIYNLQGAMIMSTVVNDNTIELDLSTLKSGAYIIKANSDTDVFTNTIIKQ